WHAPRSPRCGVRNSPGEYAPRSGGQEATAEMRRKSRLPRPLELRLRRAALPQDVLRGFELEGRMRDVEVAGQAFAEVVEQRARVGVGAHHDVRGHDMHA